MPASPPPPPAYPCHDGVGGDHYIPPLWFVCFSDLVWTVVSFCFLCCRDRSVSCGVLICFILCVCFLLLFVLFCFVLVYVYVCFFVGSGRCGEWAAKRRWGKPWRLGRKRGRRPRSRSTKRDRWDVVWYRSRSSDARYDRGIPFFGENVF